MPGLSFPPPVEAMKFRENWSSKPDTFGRKTELHYILASLDSGVSI